MSSSVANLDALKTEHDALIDEEQETYKGSERADRISYFEQFYVGDFQLIIYQHLRFYRRTKGKRAGKIVSLYVNPDTGKAMSQKRILEKYLHNPEPEHSPAISMKQRIDNTTQFTAGQKTHLYNHIVAKMMDKQKETLKRLRKEKQ